VRSLFGICVLILLATFTACTGNEAVVSPTIPSPSATTSATSQDILETVAVESKTPVPPTGTSAPLAALVNGEGILLEDYQLEVTLYQSAVGTSLATKDKQFVLDDLIDQVLLAQAAVEAGFEVDEAMIQQRIEELGIGEQALSDWKTEYGYSEAGFSRAMKRAIASAWMRDQLIAEVPQTSEQVHARQILLYTQEEAEAVYIQLQTGAEFGSIAAEYDPITRGELGWFPRGYLTVSELDDVLFSLEPGEYSEVIETMLGFHIVQVLEHQADYPLSVNAYQVVQLQSLAQWLDDRRGQSEIILLVP
jgi:peptidyl-prolyl cis-trans isomerase C